MKKNKTRDNISLCYKCSNRIEIPANFKNVIGYEIIGCQKMSKPKFNNFAKRVKCCPAILRSKSSEKKF